MTEYEVRRLDTLVPYWRNPRRVTDEAVNAVAESIRQFGYQQPIAVDTENVIVVGHTRYAALRRLGYQSASVRVIDDLSPQQIKQLRLVDNRTSELSMWDFDAMVAEMTDLDADLMLRYFPEIAPSVFGQIADADEDVVTVDPSAWEVPVGQEDIEFICPACFHMFTSHVTRDDVLTGAVLRGEAK